MIMIGIHINSDPANIIKEVDRAKSMGAFIVQLFVDPCYKNQQVYKDFSNKLKDNGMKCIVHASYTINLAQYWDPYSYMIKQFIAEIRLASIIGAVGIVVHTGKKLELSKEEAYNNAFTALMHVFNATKNNGIKIFIETPAGQGTEICYKLEELAHFYKKLSHHKNKAVRNKFGICIDTCHIFAAGYDIRTEELIELYLDNVEELIGMENIGLIHLNDSKQGLGDRIDRHASLGDGQIGREGLILFAKIFKKLGVSIVLETPNSQNEIGSCEL